ncbi:hypothetical protein SDC9_186427 [bioreactor metagenome]|uniref:Uncharacterized protein n=1 Tax=bioreactor metagenome TaxID=1076179 RepID=A0A645HKH9_9ZZZZ
MCDGKRADSQQRGESRLGKAQFRTELRDPFSRDAERFFRYGGRKRFLGIGRAFPTHLLKTVNLFRLFPYDFTHGLKLGLHRFENFVRFPFRHAGECFDQKLLNLWHDFSHFYAGYGNGTIYNIV